jgi:hypothetical protein
MAAELSADATHEHLLTPRLHNKYGTVSKVWTLERLSAGSLTSGYNFSYKGIGTVIV